MELTVDISSELIDDMLTVSGITGMTPSEIVAERLSRYLFNFREDSTGKINPRKGRIVCSGDEVTVLDTEAEYMGNPCMKIWAALDGFGPGIRRVPREDVEVDDGED